MYDTNAKSAGLDRIRERAGWPCEPKWLMQIALEELSRIPHFDWVGFYLLSRTEPNMLELGPFVGAPTPHTRIPVDQGICGAAVSAEKTIIVDDVASDPRYLACSIETKSEIVVPIFVRGKVVGELDLDSHTPAAFTPEHRAILEECAALVGRAMETWNEDGAKAALPRSKQVVAALIENPEGKLLICQRTKHQPLPLKWEFPGGKIEPGEGARQALQRELEEELGIQAEIAEQVTALQHLYKNGNAVDLQFFAVRRYEGELENRIFADIRWAERASLPAFDFLDADRELVQGLAAGKYLARNPVA
jgi:GAF domain-containing protein